VRTVLGAMSLTPVGVGEHPVGDPVQPEAGALVVRHLVEAAPGDEERLGHDIGGVRRCELRRTT